MTRVVEGGETPIFKQFFSGWRDEGEQVGMGKVFRQGALGMMSLVIKKHLNFEILSPIFDNMTRCFVFVFRSRFKLEGRGSGLMGTHYPFRRSKNEKEKKKKKIDVNIKAEI